MRIVCALDVHRRQISYLTVDVGSGEVSRGRISPATRGSVREWLTRFDEVDDVQFALEGTTGWRFVGQLVLAPPLVFGGELGDHVTYHWRQRGIEHVVSLHAWAPPLPEAVATLKLLVDSATVTRVSWRSAKRLVRGCKVGAVEQTHRRMVTLTLRTGQQVFTAGATDRRHRHRRRTSARSLPVDHLGDRIEIAVDLNRVAESPHRKSPHYS